MLTKLKTEKKMEHQAYLAEPEIKTVTQYITQKRRAVDTNGHINI